MASRNEKSAAQLRYEMDEDVRDYLDNTYGQQEWSKEEATGGYLTLKNMVPGAWDYEHMTQVVRVSIGRVCHEQHNGMNRYWWTGGDCYQDPTAIPEEILYARSRGYKATARGLVGLAAQHDLVRNSKGVKVDTSEIDDLIADLTNLKSQL